MRRGNMHIFVFRLSMFGDFKKYVPTTANVIAWTQALQQEGFSLLPSIIQQPPQLVNFPFAAIPTGAISPSDKRIQFLSPDGTYSVRILAERVDVEITQGVADTFEEYFADKLKFSSDLMKAMIHVLSDVQGCRLAYYVDALLPEPSGKSFEKFYDQNNFNISIDGSLGTCVEWSHRFNKRFMATIGEKNELSNAILLMESGMLQTINPSTGEQQSVKGLHILSDINTLAENMKERFAVKDLLDFSTSAQSVFLKFLEQIKTKLFE